MQHSFKTTKHNLFERFPPFTVGSRYVTQNVNKRLEKNLTIETSLSRMQDELNSLSAGVSEVDKKVKKLFRTPTMKQHKSMTQPLMSMTTSKRHSRIQ